MQRRTFELSQDFLLDVVVAQMTCQLYSVSSYALTNLDSGAESCAVLGFQIGPLRQYKNSPYAEANDAVPPCRLCTDVV